MPDHPPAPNEAPQSSDDLSLVQARDYCTQLLYEALPVTLQTNRYLGSAIDVDNVQLPEDSEVIANLLGKRGQSQIARSPPPRPPKPFNKGDPLSRTTSQHTPLFIRNRPGLVSSHSQNFDPKYYPYPRQHATTISPNAPRHLDPNHRNRTFPVAGQASSSSQSQISSHPSFENAIQNATRPSSSLPYWAPQEHQWPRVYPNVSGYEETGLTPDDGPPQISQTVEPLQTLLVAPPFVNSVPTRLGDDAHHEATHAPLGQMPSIASSSRTSADEVCQAQIGFESIQRSYEDGTELHVNRTTSNLPHYDLNRSTTVESGLDQAHTTPHKSVVASNDLSASFLVPSLDTLQATAGHQSIISANSESNVDNKNSLESQEALATPTADAEPPTTEMEAERLRDHFRKQGSKYRCIYVAENGPCNSPFSRKSRLLDHIRAHTGDKPYVCKKECPQNPRGCELSYSSAESLRNHRKEKMQCDTCGGHITYSNFARHKKLHQSPQA
ncbi:hypothetical protein CPB86DRAFT_383858 [Serendipita vermifera]|nr:hypothetical protein CPB86DRAFT_383858 [Serendipita vermifera]